MLMLLKILLFIVELLLEESLEKSSLLRQEYDRKSSEIEEKSGYEEMRDLALEIEKKAEELKAEFAEKGLRKWSGHALENQNNERDINEAERYV